MSRHYEDAYADALLALCEQGGFASVEYPKAWLKKVARRVEWRNYVLREEREYQAWDQYVLDQQVDRTTEPILLPDPKRKPPKPPLTDEERRARNAKYSRERYARLRAAGKHERDQEKYKERQRKYLRGNEEYNARRRAARAERKAKR